MNAKISIGCSSSCCMGEIIITTPNIKNNTAYNKNKKGYNWEIITTILRVVGVIGLDLIWRRLN